jgi:hypothetical protein
LFPMGIAGMDGSRGFLSEAASDKGAPSPRASSGLSFCYSYFFFYSYRRSFAVRPGEASA